MAASVHLKTQTLSSKSKRRKSRETTISTFATPSIIPNSPDSFIENLTHIGKSDTPAIVTPEKALCLAPSKPFTSPQTSQQEEKLRTSPRISDPESELISFTVTVNSSSSSPSQSPSQSPTSLKLIASPTMDSSNGNGVNGGSSFGYYPSSYSKFNSALNAGLLIPLSPPPSLDKTRSSPTLFEMMANEQDCLIRNQISTKNVPISSAKPQISVLDKQALLQHRVSEILGNCSPGNQFNDSKSSDVKLTLSSKDGIRVTINVHRQILVTHSKFFAAKLSDRRSWPQRSLPHIFEIPDCDDIEIYIETLRLMYCKDLRRKLMKEDVSKVLEILKVSASIVFEAGVSSCLEYLEATPWTEDEEEKVAYLLAQLNLEEARAGEVLKRVLMEESRGEEGNNNEEVLIKLLHVVLEGKDEKARREMKSLILKMLRENSCQSDLSKESLYSACDGCLQLLHLHFLQAAELEFQDVGQNPRQPLQDVGQIARQADNLHWILDILIDRQIAEDFLKTWANQSELSEIHSKVPAIHRFEVSRVTARLFVGIGKGKILACKEVRYLLLRTWLRPFYDDFAWMKRASKGLDRHLIEEGLSNTILTLPLAWQQEIFLSWFHRFLNSAEDCPNIQRGFEVWWRRAFWRRNDEPDMARHLRIVSATCENS